MSKQKNIPMSNEEIIEAFCENKQIEIGKLYKKMRPEIEKLIQNNSGCKADTDDIMQEIFLTFCLKVRSKKTVIENCRNYILGIAKNKWFDELRKRKKKRITDISPLINTIIVKEDINLEVKIKWFIIFDELLQKLDNICQEALTSKKSLKELSKDWAYTYGSFRNKAVKCKKQLLKLVQKNPKYKQLLKEYPFLKKIQKTSKNDR